VTQSLLQTLIQDIPNFWIDMYIIRDKDQKESVEWYWISFGYSVFLTFVLVFHCANEAQRIERCTNEAQHGIAKPMPPVPASTSTPGNQRAIMDGRV
jgi:hypothetical protein